MIAERIDAIDAILLEIFRNQNVWKSNFLIQKKKLLKKWVSLLHWCKPVHDFDQVIALIRRRNRLAAAGEHDVHRVKEPRKRTRKIRVLEGRKTLSQGALSTVTNHSVFNRRNTRNNELITWTDWFHPLYSQFPDWIAAVWPTVALLAAKVWDIPLQRPVWCGTILW